MKPHHDKTAGSTQYFLPHLVKFQYLLARVFLIFFDPVFAPPKIPAKNSKE